MPQVADRLRMCRYRTGEQGRSNVPLKQIWDACERQALTGGIVRYCSAICTRSSGFCKPPLPGEGAAAGGDGGGGGCRGGGDGRLLECWPTTG